MKRLTFDTNIFLHNIDILLDDKYKEYELVSVIPVIAELDNIKVNSSRMDLKYKGKVATRKLKQYIKEGKMKPLVVTEVENLISLNKYDVVDDLIISICKKENIKLVTMDFNVYLKCLHLNVEVELVESETKIENLSMVYKGKKTPIYVPKNIIDKVFSNGYVKFDEVGSDVEFNPNECTTLIDYSNEKCKVMVKYIEGKFVKIRYSEKSEFWGLKAISEEQKFALGLLNDDDIRIVTLTGKAGSSKAQPNSTPIPTPNGWTTMGELKVGDYVFDRLGRKTKVLGVYPQGIKPTYRVTLSDGRSTLCADEHLWDVYTSKKVFNKRKNENTKPFTMTTLELKEKVREESEKIVYRKDGTSRSKFVYIQNNNAIEYTKKELKVDPYVLGVLLGDGCLTCCGLQMSSSEEDIVKDVANRLGLDYKHSGQNNYTWSFRTIDSKQGREVKKNLKDMGLLVKAHEKHIPSEYLESSIEDRMELLKGLMDTDGTVSAKNRLSFSTTSPRLRDDFAMLCRSLGLVASIRKTMFENIEGKRPLYEIGVQTNTKIFNSNKHRKRWNDNIDKYNNVGKYHNDFVRVIKVEEVEQQENTCIYVDNEEHLYLTEDYIVTHNTILSFAVGLEKKVNNFGNGKLYIARPPVSLSRKLQMGYKKGDLLDKAIGSLGSYSTNLERLAESKGEKRKIDGSKLLRDMLEQCEISYLNIEDILGMSFSDDDYIIVDEAELLTKDEMKAILSRGGKQIIIGDCEQASDNSGVDYDNSGLLHLIEVGKKSNLIAHLTLEEVYRSEIVKEINEIW